MIDIAYLSMTKECEFMKKVILSVLVSICMLGTSGCGLNKEHNVNVTPVFFVATVTEVNEGSLLVEVTDNGSTSLREGTAAHVSTDLDGYTGCAVGDSIRIEFDGMIQELYPPIIPNVISITKGQ